MKKYAILRRNGLGDFISGCVPLCLHLINFKNVRQEQLYFFVSELNQGLVKYFFPNSNVCVIPRGNKYISAIKIALENRKNYDVGLLPVPDYPKLGSLFMYTLGCKSIYGRSYGSKIATCLINNEYKESEGNVNSDEHVALTSLRIFDKSIKSVSRELYPWFDKNIIKDSKHRKLKDTLILCEVSNNRKTSQLCVDSMMSIFNSLYAIHKFSVLISSKEDDIEKAMWLKEHLNMDSEICVSGCIDEFISLVNSADIVLTGDGGLGHIAGALGKKIVALYGVTSVEQWGILSENCCTLFDEEDVNNISKEAILNLLQKFLAKD